MSWGDPYDKLYKDGNYAARKADLAMLGFMPGAAVKVGSERIEGNERIVQPIVCYVSPSLEVSGHRLAMPGIGMIIAVDCETDPVINWIMVSLPSCPTGAWFTSVMVVPVGSG